MYNKHIVTLVGKNFVQHTFSQKSLILKDIVLQKLINYIAKNKEPLPMFKYVCFFTCFIYGIIVKLLL